MLRVGCEIGLGTVGWSRSVLVLRCQLPSDAIPAILRKERQTVCTVCGGPAQDRCGKCRKAWYCCRNHQGLDWKKQHKSLCGTLVGDTTVPLLSLKDAIDGGAAFPEFAIVCETEPDAAERDAAARASLPASLQEPTGDEDSIALADAMDAEQDTLKANGDATAAAFNARTSYEPDQVLRCACVLRLPAARCDRCC
jgi:pre-rRNA-processing protein TSR4